LRDIVGTKSFDWTVTGYGGTVQWSDGVLETQSGFFKTPSQSTESLIIVFHAPEAATNYFFHTPDLSVVGQGYASIGATVRKYSGWSIVSVPVRANSTALVDGLTGGWEMMEISQASATTGTCGIGGYNYTTGACTELLKIGAIFICASTPTDTERRQILNYARREQARRGIYLTPKDCPRKAHLASIVGESTGAGTALLSTLSERAANNENVLIRARDNQSSNTAALTLNKLVYTSGYANANAPASASTKCGLERGLMLTRIAGPNDGRPLHIAKLANGSTFLVPPGVYSPNAEGATTTVSAGISRNATVNDTTTTVSNMMFYTLEHRNLMRVERQARNNGIGYTTHTELWCEGLNDAYIGTVAVASASAYQAYLQDRRDKLILFTGINNLKQVLLKPHLPSGGLGGGDPDYPNDSAGADRLVALGYIRTACDSFQAANSADVWVLDGDTYGVNSPSDYIHPSAAQYEAMGAAMAALLTYSTEVTPSA
jgi:lysophospholipase L1-like esterase